MNQRSCVSDFFHGLKVNETVTGFYNRYDFHDIQLFSLKPYTWTGGEIAGIVLLCIGTLASTVTTVVVCVQNNAVQQLRDSFRDPIISVRIRDSVGQSVRL